MPTFGTDCTFTYNFQIIVQKSASYFHDIDLTNEDTNLTVTFGVGEFITVKCVEGYVSLYWYVFVGFNTWLIIYYKSFILNFVA